jgi:hypothetical protein
MGRPVWDCVHPCAAIILGDKVPPELLKETLDAYGYLTEDGTPDIEFATSELSRVLQETVKVEEDVEPEGQVASKSPDLDTKIFNQALGGSGVTTDLSSLLQR